MSSSLARRPSGCDLRLAGGHIDLVVVHGVQGRGGGRGDPGATGPGLGVIDLGRDHGAHLVGHGPHPLADLGVAEQPAGEADVHVPVLIGQQPGGCLHGAFAQHGAALHGGVDLVPRAVEEAGIDEDDPLGGGADALLEVHRGAPLLVHDADLERIAGQSQGILDPAEQVAGEGDLLGPVHLGLDDVDAAGAGVAVGTQALEVVDCRQAGDQGVEDALRDLGTVGGQHRVGGHQVADVAHQQEAAPGQGQGAAVGGRVGAVWLQRDGPRCAPPLSKVAVRSPRIRPSQLR